MGGRWRRGRHRSEHRRLMAMRKPLLEPARSAFGVRSQQLPLFCFWLLPNSETNQRRKGEALFCLLPHAGTNQRRKVARAPFPREAMPGMAMAHGGFAV